MRFKSVGAVLVSSLLLTGCDKPATQHITATLALNGEPLGGAAVRLYFERHCRGEFLESMSSNVGVADWSRTVTIGGIDVVTDEISLCVPKSDGWRELYWSRHGPAPRRIEMYCDVARAEAAACEVKMDGTSHDA
jgi:hypothetical protein